TGENIYSENERGRDPIEASELGAQRVATPVALAVGTTIVAFVPLLFAPGIIGKFLYQIPAVVMIVLVISVVEAMFILPHHLSHLRVAGHQARTRFGRWMSGLRHRMDAGLRKFIDGPLDRALQLATDRYGVVIASSITLMLLTLGLIVGGYVKFNFFPQVEGRHITASFELAQGATAQASLKVAERIEAAGRQAARELPDPSGRELIAAVFTSIGRQEVAGPGAGAALGILQGHKGSVVIELLDPELRSVNTNEFERKWRELVGSIPEVRKISFVSNVINVGSAVQIAL
ncbi:MAG: efflux RND transporter permease subunit, partial [Quisquiliibacterium sp.]